MQGQTMEEKKGERARIFHHATSAYSYINQPVGQFSLFLSLSLSLSLSLEREREREREREKERKLANWLVDIGICRCRVMKYSRPFSLLFFHRLPLHRCPYFATSSSCFSLFRLLREGKGSERVIRITYYPKTALAKGLQGLDVSIYERCSRDATRRWGPLSTIYGSTEFELCNYPRFRLGDALYAERDEKHNRTFVISNEYLASYFRFS